MAMAYATGENEQGLRKILDLTRLISIGILVLHVYFQYYGVFRQWQLTNPITDRLLHNIAHTGLFTPYVKAKGIALGFLFISLLGAKGRKNQSIKYRTAFFYILTGVALYFGSYFLHTLSLEATTLTMAYSGITLLGYLFTLSGGNLLSRMVQQRLSPDVFNKANETFPQEERLLHNEYSINLPATYILKGRRRKSWINILNPFRGLLVMGSPGSGKSYFVIRQVIRQHLQKGFSMLVYDFKWDDLSRYTYHHFLQNEKQFKVKPSFYLLNFDDLSRTHRCNPLAPEGMHDLTDAAEASRTILLALNREWIRRQGDFFVESAINFVTALIWYLRKYESGIYCTLPHVIELMQVPNDKLFSILQTETEVRALINPFVTAYEAGVMEQVEGQVAAAKIAMARLSSPQLYYVLSGNDFTLDINNEKAPKVLCMGNNPQKTDVYGAVLSLYLSRLMRMVNQKGSHPSSLIFDEFATVFLGGIDHLIATARSNKVATTLAVQDGSQLRKDYGREQSDVILNIIGNVISGQVMGDTAKQLSERFGRILQERTSLSTNSSDTSVSTSKQLEAAIPPSTIASLSSGEFVGMVADNVDQPVQLKTFHARILQQEKEPSVFKDLPMIRTIDQQTVRTQYEQIKKDIALLIKREIRQILNERDNTDLS
jgi:hypothetical protein